MRHCFQQFEGNSPFNLYVSPVSGTNGVDALMLGMADRLANKFDSSFAFTIRERLFREKPGVQGLDLPALNIQRARDHGVAGACVMSINFYISNSLHFLYLFAYMT